MYCMCAVGGGGGEAGGELPETYVCTTTDNHNHQNIRNGSVVELVKAGDHQFKSIQSEPMCNATDFFSLLKIFIFESIMLPPTTDSW